MAAFEKPTKTLSLDMTVPLSDIAITFEVNAAGRVLGEPKTATLTVAELAPWLKGVYQRRESCKDIQALRGKICYQIGNVQGLVETLTSSDFTDGDAVEGAMNAISAMLREIYDCLDAAGNESMRRAAETTVAAIRRSEEVAS